MNGEYVRVWRVRTGRTTSLAVSVDTLAKIIGDPPRARQLLASELGCEMVNALALKERDHDE